MRRREFLGVFGGAAAAWPLAARAQQPAKLHRVFWASTESQPDPFVDGFREGLRERGYVEGRNVVLELRYAPGNPDALRAVISELTRRNWDLAVSSGPAIRALRAATDIPVLFAISGDPVELGLVKTLARPGGNFTGSTFLSLDLAGKRVQLLKDVFPQLRRLAVLSNTDHPGERGRRACRCRKRARGCDAGLSGRRHHGAPRQTCRIRRRAATALDVRVERILRRRRTAELRREPARNLFPARPLCRPNPARRKSGRSSGRAADKIRARRPTRFELVVNLKTAKALGIEIPTAILLRAEKVIE